MNKMLIKWVDPKTIFTAMFYIVFLVLIVRKVAVPDDLKMMVSTLFGFWFGLRTTKQEVSK
jgi:hypothetical protein